MATSAESVTRPLVTGIVSTVELSDVFLTVRLPAAAFCTGSLKWIARFATTATLVALSAGVKASAVGGLLSIPPLTSSV